MKKIFGAFCLIFLFCSVPGEAAGLPFPKDQLFHVISIPEFGDYYLDSTMLYRKNDVITYGYKEIISEQYKDHLLQLLKKSKNGKERQRVKEWAFSISFAQINPRKKTWRPISSTSYNKRGKILESNDTSHFPFAPMPEIGTIERCIIASVMMHEEWIRDE